MMVRALPGLPILLLPLLTGGQSTPAAPLPVQTAAPAPSPAPGLGSLRARRRAVALLRMRLLERREAELERARQAIERGLPVDQLLGLPSAPAVLH